MKRVIMSLLVTLLLCGCGGISDSQKEDMRLDLEVCMNDAFLDADGIAAMGVEVDLLSVKDEPYPGYTDGSWGVFSCTFSDGDHRVILHGDCGFDKDGFLFRDGRESYAVNLYSAIVDGRSIPLYECVYNLPTFIGGRKK